jgi:hypothetical protein
VTRRAAAWLLVLAAGAAAPVRTAQGQGTTDLFEWVSKAAGSQMRLTLFFDHTLVRKTTGGGSTALKKRLLSPEEYDYYARFFSEPDSTRGAGSFESGMTGDMVAESVATFHLPDGRTWRMSWDSFSAFSIEAMRVRAALLGLRDSFGKVLPSPGDFAPDKIPPGTVLRRRDGAEFRVMNIDATGGMVELRGINEPYSEFLKIDDLRYTFAAP